MLWGIYSAIYGEVNVTVEKCVEIKGDYVEKQQSCFISVTLKSWSGRKILDHTTYVVGSKSFRPDIEKPRQMENAVRDI